MGSCRKCQRQNQLNYSVRVDLVAYLNKASGAGGWGAEIHGGRDGAGWRERKRPPLPLPQQLRGLPGWAREAAHRPGRGGPGPERGRVGGGGPSSGAVNFS